MIKLKNKGNVAIVGFGIEGKDVLNFLLKSGYTDITVFDRKDKAELDLQGIDTAKISFITGPNYLKKGLSEYSIIYRSPGVYRYLPEIVEAEKSGCVISSNIKLFFEQFHGLSIGVTGTKGKGTTSTIIYKILTRCYGKRRKVFLAGNIGSPPLSILDKVGDNDIVVLELSSFQLIDLQKSPNISVVLNITSDHMDWHKSQIEYLDAKKNIVEHQVRGDYKILNYDYSTSKKFTDLSPSQNYFFSRNVDFSADTETVIARTERTKQSQDRLPRYVPKSRTSLAMTNNPKTVRGVYVKDGKIVTNIHPGGAETPTSEVLGDTKDLLLRGKHNWENVCAAICAAQLAGADIETIKKVVFSFTGLEHRLELVGEIEAVKYYNDSFSTNPQTTIAAVDSFNEPITLILGGYDKGLDFEEMVKHLCTKENLRNIILIGDVEPKLLKLLKEFKYKNSVFKMGKSKMTEIVAKCQKITNKGGIILLSPACASFDMFESYKDRGNQFKEAVESFYEIKFFKAKTYKI